MEKGPLNPLAAKIQSAARWVRNEIQGVKSNLPPVFTHYQALLLLQSPVGTH